MRSAQTGIRLGRTEKVRNLAWSEVQQLRISAQNQGVRLEIVLGPSVPVSYRGLGRQLADLAFFSLRSWEPGDPRPLCSCRCLTRRGTGYR